MRTLIKTLITTLMLTTTLTLTGCPPLPCDEPIVGTWEGQELVDGHRHRMAIADDLQGVATLWFSSLVKFSYNVYVSPVAAGKYEIEFECDGNCAPLDFSARCEMWGHEELTCRELDDIEFFNIDWRLKY